CLSRFKHKIPKYSQAEDSSALLAEGKLQLQFFGYLEDQDYLHFSLCSGTETEEDLNGQRKHEVQWTPDERKAANLDQRLKSLIMSVLPDDQINSVINCLTAKSTWDDLILYHEVPFDVKENRIMNLKLCYNTFKFKKDSPNDEEDTRSCQEYLNNLKEEYQARALLAKSKRFFKKRSQRFSSAKATKETECYKCGRKCHFARDCFSKTSVPYFSSPFHNNTQPGPINPSEHKLTPKVDKDFETKYNKVKAILALLSLGASASNSKQGKGLVAETHDWDEEEVSYDEDEMVHTLLELEDNDDRKSFLNDLCTDLNYVEEQRNNFLSKHRDLVEILKICKEQLMALERTKLDFFTLQHANTEILKENQNLREELKELKYRVLGVEDPSSFGKKDFVLVKPLAEGFILPYHDTRRIPLAESQMNTTNPSVAVTDSSASDYDLTNGSLVCSIPLPLLEKLSGVETVSGPKTIKSTSKSNSTFKAKALKSVIINEPSPALAKVNKKALASKNISAPVDTLKNVKTNGDPYLASVIKELNDLKLQVSKNQSSSSRNNKTQQVPQNTLQNAIDDLSSLECLIGGLVLHSDGDDNWVWKGDVSRSLKVKTLSKSLQSLLLAVLVVESNNWLLDLLFSYTFVYESLVSKFSKHNVYSTKAILGVMSVSVKNLHGYGDLEEIVVKRSNQQLYKFKECNCVDLHLNDIEDMLLLAV
ncbi:retrovirus-related pol polyprotein from transposon TNT 1-94, partial [Tanacetum coccineum]